MWVRDLSPKKNTEQKPSNRSKGTGGKRRWVPLFPFHLHGGEGKAHSMFKMRCKFKFETHFLCMDSLKALPGESKVPMMLWGHNDLGMRLQKLTANFGLLRSELTNYSQMGVVNFPLRLFRDNGDTIGAIHYCLKVMKCSFPQWRARATFAYQKSVKCLSLSLYQPCNCKQSCYFAFMAKLMVEPC